MSTALAARAREFIQIEQAALEAVRYSRGSFAPVMSAIKKDQVDGAARLGIPATFLNSSLTPEESRERWKEVASGRLRLLYLSPERIANEAFRRGLGWIGLSFIAVDEAHCVSEWGHEFRPDYRALGGLRKEFPDVPIAAFTATAGPPTLCSSMAGRTSRRSAGTSAR